VNLRKDHSHVHPFDITTVNSGCEVLLRDGDSDVDTPVQELKGGRAGWVLCHLLSVPVVTPLSPLFISSHQFIGSACPLLFSLQLSAIDVSARRTMKGAANCDKHCELQNSVNQ
jgi:hypothetical protein